MLLYSDLQNSGKRKKNGVKVKLMTTQIRNAIQNTVLVYQISHLSVARESS